MATVFSELSFDYASALTDNHEISLFVFRTSEDGQTTNSGLITRGAAVPAAHRDQFEIQVIPSGDTGRIIQNDFGGGFTPMTSFKRLKHRVERESTDPAGTTQGSVTLEVSVRRAYLPTESYVRNVVLNHSISTETSGPAPSTWDAALPLQGPYTDGGLYQENRAAFVEFLFYANGQIRIRSNYPYSQDALVGTWSGALANSTNTEIRVTRISGAFPTYNGAVNWTPLNQTVVFNYLTESDVANSSYAGDVRVELRQIGGTATVAAEFRVWVFTSTDPGSGGNGSDIPF